MPSFGDPDPGCSCGFGPPGDPNCPEHGAYIRESRANAPPRTESVLPCAFCGVVFEVKHTRGEAHVAAEQAALVAARDVHERACRQVYGEGRVFIRQDGAKVTDPTSLEFESFISGAVVDQKKPSARHNGSSARGPETSDPASRFVDALARKLGFDLA